MKRRAPAEDQTQLLNVLLVSTGDCLQGAVLFHFRAMIGKRLRARITYESCQLRDFFTEFAARKSSPAAAIAETQSKYDRWRAVWSDLIYKLASPNLT